MASSRKSDLAAASAETEKLQSTSTIVVSSAPGHPGMVIVLGELSFDQLYDFLLNLSCSNELKFWMACNAVCNFKCVEASCLYTLHSDFLTAAVTYKVKINDSTMSNITKLLFLSLSLDSMRIKELLGMAQFEIVRTITGGCAGDLPFIYDLIINNCCFFSKKKFKDHTETFCTSANTAKIKSRKRRHIPEQLPTKELLQKVQKRLTDMKFDESKKCE